MKSFEVHGTLDVKVENSMLVIEGSGPWNMESLKESAKSAKPLVEGLYDQAWGVLAILRGEPIYVPEAVNNLIEVVAYEKTRGRVASALLVNDCDSPSFAKNHIGDIYERAGETFRFFNELDEAKRWLQEQILGHSNQDTQSL